MNWFSEHSGETFVVKVGGNALDGSQLSPDFISDLKGMLYSGIRVILSHGAGPQISKELEHRSIQSEFRDGQRVTSEAAAEVVREVLIELGSELARQLRSAGLEAVAVPGDENGFLTGRRLTEDSAGLPIDLGFVGVVDEVRTELIEEQIGRGAIPLVSAIARENGTAKLLNVNADLAAASIASALGADRLLLLTNVEGLFENWPDRSSLLERLSLREAEFMLGKVEQGMIPKLAACRDAVASGVRSATILDGRVRHPLSKSRLGKAGTTVWRD